MTPELRLPFCRFKRPRTRPTHGRLRVLPSGHVHISAPYISLVRLSVCLQGDPARYSKSVIVTLYPGHADAGGGHGGTLDSLRAWEEDLDMK